MGTQRICNAMGETGTTLKMKSVIDISDGFKVEKDMKTISGQELGISREL